MSLSFGATPAGLSLTGPRSPPRALALNCSAPINDRKGAEAKDWRSGKPVRVVRNVKGRKHSKYAPAEGNRYDGIYKVSASGPASPPAVRPQTPHVADAGRCPQVVRYWPEKGKSGFLVWRYLLRRDDAEPGPWTKEGKDRIKKLGLTMQVRPGRACRLSPGSPALHSSGLMPAEPGAAPRRASSSRPVAGDRGRACLREVWAARARPVGARLPGRKLPQVPVILSDFWAPGCTSQAVPFGSFSPWMLGVGAWCLCSWFEGGEPHFLVRAVFREGFV